MTGTCQTAAWRKQTEAVLADGTRNVAANSVGTQELSLTGTCQNSPDPLACAPRRHAQLKAISEKPIFHFEFLIHHTTLASLLRVKYMRYPALATVLTLLGSAITLAADDLPSFEPGMWSFSSTVMTSNSSKPQTRSVRKCTDATEDIRRKWSALARQSCKFSPVSHDGNRYAYSSMCQKNGMALEMKSTLIANGRTAYRVETESRTNSQMQKEVLIAQRMGACEK